MADEMILVIFNSSIEEEMLEVLKQAGMTCYTKIPGVHGAGRYSEPRLDSHVWPGTNVIYLIAVEPGQRRGILDAVRRMKQVHRAEGVSAFVIPLAGEV